MSLCLSLSLSLCTSRQERGCEGCHKERYDAAWNRFRFPQLWNFISSYVFPFQSYSLFLNTVVPFSLCPTVPTLPILTLSNYSHFAQGRTPPNRYTSDIPCAILELSGTIPELADKVRITDSYFAPNIYISTCSFR